MTLFDWIYKLSRCSIGGIFIYAGSIKLLDPHNFAVLIEAYGILPGDLLLPIALFLPALELVAGIGLLFNLEGSLPVAAGLLLLFVAVLGYGIWMGLDVDCGCFGPDDREAEAFHGLRLSLYRDLIMLGGMALIYGWRRYRGIKPVKITLLTNKLFGKRGRKDAYV